MFALILLVILVVLFYLPSFGFKIRVGNKEFKVETSEIDNSESS
jgi:Sec-independent protein translocase protein TatA